MASTLFLQALPRVAELLVRYSLDLKLREDVMITTTLESVELAKAIAFEAIRAGAMPHIRLSLEEVNEFFYKNAPRELLGYVSPLEEYSMERIHALVSIIAPRHMKPLQGVDPSRLALRASATRKLTEIFMRRDGEGSLKWVVTAYPTPAMAQEAGMTPLEMEEFVYKALKLHEKDPIEAWKRQARGQEKVRE